MQVTVSPALKPFSGVWPTMSELSAGSGYVFQCRDYLEVWLETIGRARNTKPYFLRVDNARGEIMMLLPLGIETVYGLRVLKFLDGGVVDYNAPIFFPAARTYNPRCASELWRQITKALPPFDFVNLQKIPSCMGGFRNPMAELSCDMSGPGGYVIPITGTWEDYCRTRFSNLKDNARKRRQLERNGSLTYAVAGSQDEADRFLAAMIRLKTQKYPASFADPGYVAYFQTMTKRFFSKGHVHVSALVSGDQIIAAHWGLVGGKRFYYLMPSYDEAWSKFSPGRILLEHLIGWSFANGIEVFDVGVGDEPYKIAIPSTRVPLAQVKQGANMLGKTLLPIVRLVRGKQPA